MALNMTRNFMMISRVSLGRRRMDKRGKLTNLISEQPIQCIARVKHHDATCEYRFSYETSSDSNINTRLKIQDTTCPPISAATYGLYGLGIIAIATFLLGLIFIIIFKVNIILADRREYAKFQEEQKQTQYALQMSPLYKSPISEYKNPFSFENENIYESPKF